MCASTLCPLSSSTLNCVFGSASVTVPSTSMTSSLAKDLLSRKGYKMAGAKRICYHARSIPHTPRTRTFLPAHLAIEGQHPRAVLGDGDGVLEVGGEGAVGGVNGPAIPLADADIVAPERDHGLYGEGHPRQEARARAWPAVVGDLGVLVHLAPDPVGDEIPHDPVATRLGQGLYGVPDIPQPPARARLLGGRLEAPPGGLEEPVGLLGDLPDLDGGGRVGHEALVAHADVEGDDVPLFQAVGAGDAVHDHGVGRGADRGRETLVALELWPPAPREDELLGQSVELLRRDAGADVPREHPEAGCGNAPALAHGLELGLALADDQAFSPTASSISSVTSEMPRVASTVTRIPLSA